MFGNFQISDEMLRALMQWKQQQGGGTLPGMSGPGGTVSGVTQDLQNMSMEKDWLGRNIGPSAVGSAQGVSPGGEAHNQFMQSEYMKAPPSSTNTGGLDPKSRMMLMVGQQLFNRSREEEQPLQPMRTSPVSVGAMPAMSGDAMKGMQMQRGNMPDFRLGGGGVLSDPNRRRQRRAQFLYGI
jgi:hypothetical protein